MKCGNCGREIPELWLEGIEDPKCPACGKELLINKEEQKSAANLTEEENWKIYKEKMARIEAEEKIKADLKKKEKTKKIKIAITLMVVFAVILFGLRFLNKSKNETAWKPPANQNELKGKFINILLNGAYKDAGLKDANYEGERLTVYWDRLYWNQIPYKYKEEAVQTIGEAWLKTVGPNGWVYFKDYHSNKTLATAFSLGIDIEK